MVNPDDSSVHQQLSRLILLFLLMPHLPFVIHNFQILSYERI